MKRFLLLLIFISVSSSLSQQVGDSALNFTLINQAGEVVNFNDDLLGTPLVINTWATWCPPCREELPLFQKVFEEVNQESQATLLESDILLVSNEGTTNSNPKLNIFLLNNAEKADRAIEYLEENNISLPSGVNPTKEQTQHWQEQGVELEETLDVVRLYRIRGMPTTFYIDAQGIIRAVKTGLVLQSDMIRDLRTIGIKWIPQNQE